MRPLDFCLFFGIRLALTALGILGLFVSSSGQSEGCKLHVTDGSEGLPFATVWLGNAPVGPTDLSGHYVFDAEFEEPKRVTVKMVGFIPATHLLACGTGEVHEIELQPATITCGAATVVGGLSAMRLKDSPVMTSVISGKSLEAVHAQDLVESIDFTNGVRETVACGVCGTNDVHINGMEGVYTLVLVDGVPLLGGLASAYALDAIPMSMVQQVEVIQGPASARFGSQAVGGVINVVMTTPRAGAASGLLRVDAHGRTVMSALAAFGQQASPWQLGLDGILFDRRIDDNGDGMTDAPTVQRITGTIRHLNKGGRRTNKWMARALLEERFGGQLDFTEADRGGETRYGERIDVRRAEMIWSSTPRSSVGLRCAGGMAYHSQASTYGTTSFNATEWTANVEALHPGWSWREGHRLSGGGSAMWDVYKDETPVDSDMNFLIPALFLEYAGQVWDETGAAKLTWIHGLRAEWPSDQGLVLAPRVNFKWSPTPLWSLRLNAGRGYRRVHLFTEEHAALDGSRNVLLQEGGLNPERSRNLSFSISREIGRERWTGRIAAHAFSTWFSERIYADFDSLPNAIVYRNIDGLGWNRGVGADVWWSGMGGWEVVLGATWLRSELFEAGNVWHQHVGDAIEFAPNFSSNLMVSWSRGRWGWNCTGQTVGCMKLPFYDDLTPLRSEPYALVNAAVEHHLYSDRWGGHTFSLGLQNATNWTQPNALIAADAPFGEAFDASRIYGPLEGRRFFIEWSWDL